MEKQRKKERPFLAWLPAIVMAVVIFCFSAQPADQSTETSDFVSRALFRLLSGLGMVEGGLEQNREFLEMMSFPVRKCAHITEYAVFHLTILYGLYQWGRRNGRWLAEAFLMVFLYACSDEFHQLFVPGRSGAFTDVLIDCIGVSVVTAGLWMSMRKRGTQTGKGRGLQA